MGYEGQGDFMGDDLDSDTAYLQACADSAKRKGNHAEYNRLMRRIERIDELERERDYDCEY